MVLHSPFFCLMVRQTPTVREGGGTVPCAYGSGDPGQIDASLDHQRCSASADALPSCKLCATLTHRSAASRAVMAREPERYRPYSSPTLLTTHRSMCCQPVASVVNGTVDHSPGLVHLPVWPLTGTKSDSNGLLAYRGGMSGSGRVCPSQSQSLLIEMVCGDR